jgi:hypothetical protein
MVRGEANAERLEPWRLFLDVWPPFETALRASSG